MATNNPERTVRDAMQAHREKEHLTERVAEKYEKTISYIPDEIEEFVGPSLGSLGRETDDYISVDKRNYDTRVEKGVDVIVTFGSGGARGYAEATVRSETSKKNDDVTVEIDGHEFEVKGWQISGVL